VGGVAIAETGTQFSPGSPKRLIRFYLAACANGTELGDARGRPVNGRESHARFVATTSERRLAQQLIIEKQERRPVGRRRALSYRSRDPRADTPHPS
jgi:hypothetical protein